MKKLTIAFAILLLLTGCTKMREKKAQQLITEGKDAFIKGDYAPAYKLFDEAIPLLPDGTQKGEILFESGRAYMLEATKDVAGRKDLLTIAESRYKDADPQLSDDEYRANVAMNLGLVRDRLENYQGAVEAYSQAIALFKMRRDRGEAHQKRAAIYRKWGRIETAKEDYEKAIEKYLDPDRKAKAHRELGNMLAEAGYFDEGMNNLGIAIARFTQPEHKAMVAFDIGLAMERAGRIGDAIANYQNVLTLSQDPLKRSDALNSIGIIYFRAGDFQTADTLFHQALALTPESPQRLVNCGFTELFLGKPDSALVKLTKAIDLDPRIKKTLSSSRELATYFVKFGDSEESRKFRVQLQEKMMPLKLPIPERGQES